MRKTGRVGSDGTRLRVPVCLEPRVALVTAVVLYVGIFVLRFIAVEPVDSISVLYVLPVGLLAVTFGAVAGLVGAGAGITLLAVWAAVTHPHLTVLGWLSRATAMFVLGWLLGATADRLRSSQRRLAATLESMLDPFVVLEPVRDRSGVVVDVRTVFANAAARHGDGVDTALLVRHPMLRVSRRDAPALLAAYRRTLDTGEPLVLDGAEFADAGDGRPRLFDVRGFRVDSFLACTWRDVTSQRELQVAQMARREAGDINDSIVQRLSVAKWMLEMGRTEQGLALVGETMEDAQRLVSDLLDADLSSGVLLPVVPKGDPRHQ